MEPESQNIYTTLAEKLEVKKNKKSLSIGVPKETRFQENRIALAPGTVNLLIKNGHSVIIESGAGNAAHFPDFRYSEAGANIVYSAAEAYKADIILKVAPPSLNEVDLLNQRQTIISTLHLPVQNEEYFKKMLSKKAIALAYEYIRDKSNAYPILRSMSEIAGNTSILIASEYLCHPLYGKGTMLGGFSGITPTDVVILGAGTVGEFAARAALGLGAQVKIFDNFIYRLRRIQANLNTRVFTSIIQPEVLLKALKTADVIIGAVHATEGRTPCIVCEDMIKQIKYGAVIVDVSIDQGGCFETSRPTSHTNPVYEKHNIIHYCVPNIASRVPHTASYALSNYFAPLILKIGEEGGLEHLLKNDQGLRQGVYMFNGILTNKFIGDSFSIPYQDIELLVAAFH
ncbi:MAG: alanine dehydrogenase [Bacteroidales bacterium]|nr:alanine dehydrogenase [Bacteroidales bacterium]